VAANVHDKVPGFNVSVQGLNTKKGFDVKVAAEISKLTGIEFQTAPNKVRCAHMPVRPV